MFTDAVRNNSTESLFTTVIGIGMDLKVDTIREVSATPGANYSNVRTTEGFIDLMSKEFGYLVTPIGFNIQVKLQSDSHVFVEGFGSPELSNLKPGDVISLCTEFPAMQNEQGYKKPGPLLCRIAS